MKCKTQQRLDLNSVQNCAIARPPFRSSFLGNFFQKSLQQSCRLCKENLELNVCPAVSRNSFSIAQLSRCRCTSSRGTSFLSHNPIRQNSQHVCSAAPPSSSKPTSERADASTTADRGRSTRPLLDSKGSESTFTANGNGSLHYAEVHDSTEAPNQLVRAPEDYVLESGELSYIDRGSDMHSADTFRCTSCSETTCQVWSHRV